MSTSKWAAPIVPVPKSDGSVRIWGVYEVTVNHGLTVKTHPLPKPDGLFATLAGGRVFTKLDFWQMHTSKYYWRKSRDILLLSIRLEGCIVMPDYVSKFQAHLQLFQILWNRCCKG